MDKIQIICDREKVDLKIGKIMYIERLDRKVVYVCESCSYKVNDSLHKILERLPEGYVRCHTGYIVNIHYVAAVYSNYIVLSDGTEIPIGRAFKDNLKNVFFV